MILQSVPGDHTCGVTLRPLDWPHREIAFGACGVDEAEFEAAERLLTASSDHRVLRRVPPVADWPLAPPGATSRRALFIDIKTTGPCLDTDAVMELGALFFSYDLHSGVIIAVDEALAFDEPAEVEALAGQAQLIIAHDAAFVRPMLEKCCPSLARANWASALAEIDWASEGLAASRVDDLLMRLGWFNDGFDAAAHARAGAFLMNLRLPRSGTPVLSALLRHARRPLMAVRATGALFEKREALKQRGYRWDSGGPSGGAAWWILTEDPQVEIAWLNAEIYPQPRTITPIPMPASRRYSAHLWSTTD